MWINPSEDMDIYIRWRDVEVRLYNLRAWDWVNKYGTPLPASEPVASGPPFGKAYVFVCEVSYPEDAPHVTYNGTQIVARRQRAFMPDRRIFDDNHVYNVAMTCISESNLMNIKWFEVPNAIACSVCDQPYI